jgi:hypothetical protein
MFSRSTSLRITVSIGEGDGSLSLSSVPRLERGTHLEHRGDDSGERARALASMRPTHSRATRTDSAYAVAVRPLLAHGGGIECARARFHVEFGGKRLLRHVRRDRECVIGLFSHDTII